MDNEFICDLQRDNLKIIQKKNGFRFGTDAVLLSDFAKDVKAKATLDLCTGSGIVPILLYAKTEAEKIVGVELQGEVAEMAKRSVELNGIQDRVEIVQGDLRELKFKKHTFDLVTCNPPYMEKGVGNINEYDTISISRHEIMCTIEDVARAAADMLKDKGHFIMVHRPARLADVLCAMRKFKLEPKRMRMVHSRVDSPPSLFLIDGALNGGRELKILPPLIMQDENGGESSELQDIYERECK